MTPLFTTSTPPKPLTHDRMRAVMIAALVTVLVEIGTLLGVFPYLDIGRSEMPWSVVPAAVVLALLGRRAFGRRTSPGAAEPFWAAVAIGIGFGTVLLARVHHLTDAPGIAIAAMGEEVVYRFSVPALVAAILLSWKVGARPARIAGFAVGALWFVLLPWHQAQMHDGTQVLPFIAFATLAAVVAYRSGAIMATAAVHTAMNMLTVLVYDGEVSRITRSAAVGILLVLLVATYGLSQAGKRVPAGGPEPVLDLTDQPTPGGVIDLRDGVLPTHTDADGTTTPLVGPDRTDADSR